MFQMFNKSAAKAQRILQIGFVTQDKKIGVQLKNFVANRDGVDLRLIQSSAVTAGKQPAGINVFVYDLDFSTEAAMQEFDRFMAERPAEIPVIVLSPAVDDEMVRWFLRLRVADWVKTPLSPGELIAACGRIIGQQAASRQDAKCLAFVGARGGVGATTLAIHAALILGAKTAPAVSTCLIDLDLVAGSAADYLDLAPSWQIDELLADPARLDDHMFEMMTAEHKSGIAVLSARRKFCDGHSLDEEVVVRTLDLASQKYQNLIIDLPRQSEGWTDSVILGSSSLFIVTDLSIPGLRTAKRLAADVTARYGAEVSPRVIVNKHTRSLFGSAISAHEVTKILGGTVAGYIGTYDKLVREAIDRGIPTTEIKSGNGLMTDLAKLIG